MAITLKNLQCGYKTPLLKDLTLNFEKGKWHFFVGSTGSGKSTLLQTIGRLIPSLGGEIEYLGGDLREKSALREFRNQCGIMFQYTDKQFFNHTIREEILFNLKRREKSEKILEDKLQETLTLLNIDNAILERSPFELSGGQKRVVALASILITEPTILLLDEPTVGLDTESKNLFFAIIKKLKDRGVTIIQISHFLEDVLEYGDTVSILSRGELDFYQDINILLDRERVVEADLEPPEILELLEIFKNYGVQEKTSSAKRLAEILKSIKVEGGRR